MAAAVEVANTNTEQIANVYDKCNVNEQYEVFEKYEKYEKYDNDDDDDDAHGIIEIVGIFG